jgi:hypothetical protein
LFLHLRSNPGNNAIPIRFGASRLPRNNSMIAVNLDNVSVSYIHDPVFAA